MKLFKEVLRISIFLLVLHGLQCLRNVHMRVPEAAERGSKVEMKCLYDLEEQELYSVKWYRGDREFCRYSPRDVPPLKVFEIPGIDVDKDASNAERIVINPATNIANGYYTCEVSADAPSFQTAQVQAYMYVVDLPTSEPIVHGFKRKYRPGMKLKVECTSKNSMPAANISFFINNEPAQTEHVWHRVEPGEYGELWTAYSTLQFVVQKKHLLTGKIKIRCTAFIYSIYSKSVEKCAEAERVRPTTSTELETTQTIVYSKHRIPGRNTSSIAGKAASGIISLIVPLLPTVLR